MSEVIVEPLGEIVKDTPDSLGDVVKAVGQGKGSVRKTWFTKLVNAYLHYRFTHRHKHKFPTTGTTESALSDAMIRNACIKSAMSGAASGAVTTGATFIATSTPTSGMFVTIPAAALGIGIEMVGRTLIHLDMTCDIAAIFGMHFDPDDPSDFWQLYGLAFDHHEHEDDEDPGADLVHRVAHAEEHEVGESVGSKVLGESVLKNLIPVLGIATSVLANWKTTKKLGDTVRRYMRFKRALDDSLKADEVICRDHLDLLCEGLWFIFTSDGKLSDEEAALLAGLVRDLEPPEARVALKKRFTRDEGEWLERLAAVEPPQRHAFLHALEVSAAVDKSVSLPEQKILARAARAMHIEFDMDRVQQMIKQFEDVGVLARDANGKWLSTAPGPGVTVR